MAYVNVADWKSEQVAEWLKGLDSVVFQYIRLFVEKNINGQQLLDLQPNDLEEIGVYKIGHQEIILQAVEWLKHFYFDLDRENLQLLALRLSCAAHSLLNELEKNPNDYLVDSTRLLADIVNLVAAVKPLACWLDRSPFCDQTSYMKTREDLLNMSCDISMLGIRGRFNTEPIADITKYCQKIADRADGIIQDVDDSLLLQPASLDLATLKKRPGDHLGFYIVPSFHGILQVGELKCNSTAHQSGKIETGDEIVQINYQTVVGWEIKEVMALLFEETTTEILLTLKKKPRHSKVFGQIYIKPYRLPCKRQMNYSTKWNDLLSPRPELLTVPNFGMPFRILNSKPIAITAETKIVNSASPPSPTPSTASNSSSQDSVDATTEPDSSKNSRIFLPKPQIPVQRRATISGPGPYHKGSSVSWDEVSCSSKQDRQWRSNSDEKADKTANDETNLRRSPPTAHCSLNWSARLCEQINPTTDLTVSDKPTIDDKENDADGIISLKQRIDSLNKAIEQTSQTSKKPKLLPKPILSNTQNTISKLESTKPSLLRINPNLVEDSDKSPRRERGKLDKSYSTPSYDYSADSKEPFTFNMKLPEEKVKSAPDNITSEVDPLTEIKKSLEMKPLLNTKPIKADPEPRTESDKCQQNEYLEIKSDGIIESAPSEPEPQKIPDRPKINKILDTISSSLNNLDSESEGCSLSEESPKLRSAPPIERCVPPREYFFPSEMDQSIKNEEIETLSDASSKQIITSPTSPTEKLIIHTTINLPVTLPRHKIDKKPLSPPEPPPRPLKGSTHPKTSQKAATVTKSASKSIPHKSPKMLRKKNPLLAKRRNISVKDLGVCDHEGWLYHRSRKISRGSPNWIKGWFIIKGTIFYGFNSRDASHARLMISLPGFTVSPAEEVKSRNFAFKVYHTGTTFYFAAESGEDLAGWVDSFSKVTVSEEEQNIVMSETDGEEEESPAVVKKDKGGHEHGPHAAIKKFTGLLSGHLSYAQETTKNDKKYNSLRKSASRKSAKEEAHSDGNHVASLDRKYLKFLSGSGKQNFVPVPTAQFRSYRRVPPMEKTPHITESPLPIDPNRSESLSCSSPVPSASPTRPPDMADYRLASLAKCNANNQRTQETTQPGGYMTLESFMLSRQEEERRQQLQHPRATNILRVPQCHAPPLPTPTVSHSAAAVTGLEHPFLLPSTSRPRTDFSSHYPKSSDNSSADFRSKYLKKTAQYQPPPWETANNNHSEESRLQPAFEMTLDRSVQTDNTVNVKTRKPEESTSSLRFKSLFGSSKSDGQKANLISSPRLRRVLFRDKKSQNNLSSSIGVPTDGATFMETAAPMTSATATHSVDVLLPNAPEYPGLEYPPVFEPGTYSLSDVSTILRTRRMRTLEHSEIDSSRFNDTIMEENIGASSNQAFIPAGSDNENNNFANRNDEESEYDVFRSTNFKRF